MTSPAASGLAYLFGDYQEPVFAFVLTVVAETQSTITFGWDPVPGVVGYRFSSAASSKFSTTWDASRTTVKFSKAAWYRVEALVAQFTATYPAVASAESRRALVGVASFQPGGFNG